LRTLKQRRFDFDERVGMGQGPPDVDRDRGHRGDEEQQLGGARPAPVAGSCTVASSGRAIDCTLTNPLGSEASVTATVQVKTQNTVTNVARVSATTPDPEPGNNTSSLQK